MRPLNVDRDYKKLFLLIADKMFPDQAIRNQVDKIFEKLGGNFFEEGRVKLGILKLCQSDLKELEQFVDLAKWDWRELLIQAEYPYSHKLHEKKDIKPEAYDKALQKEQNEYDLWIESVLKS